VSHDPEVKETLPRDCILFSTADWDEPYWTNKQHMARELAGRGWRILYIESLGLRAPQLGSSRDWKRILRRLKRGVVAFLGGPAQVEQNIWVLPPLVLPGLHHWGIARWFNRKILDFTIRRFMGRHEFDQPVIWTYHPMMLDVIGSIGHGPIVYHCVDDVSAVPGIHQENYKTAEINLLKRADRVFTTALPLKEYCEKFNPKTVYFSNVVDFEHFASGDINTEEEPPDLKEIPRPRLVYHGVLSDYKVDFQLLLDAVATNKDWHWVIIGEERQGQKSPFVEQLREMKNVHFLGYKSYKELPRYLHGMDVGLLPSLLNEYTRSMFPMKFYEYLASGLPVVSTPLDFTKGINEGIVSAAGSEKFVNGINQQLMRGRLTANESYKFVGENTWQQRTTKCLQYLNQ
jgi:glycosyltransferase involved in cell wall biosynthesis